MHIQVVFYFLLTLVSFSHLEGKNQNDGFTIELIHRYSPKSPFYNSSMTLKERGQRLALRSASRHRHHFQRLISIDIGTDIIPNDGDYLIKIAIGLPPVNLFAIADTGSDLIWVQCKPCEYCYSQTTPMFDPEKSSSYNTLPCNSTYCASDSNMQCTDDSSQECEYFYAYGNGSTISAGIMGTDLFTFDSTKSSCVFGCGLVQDGGFDNDAGGLVGLGGGPLSLVSQLGPTIANKFSYCLTPTDSNYTSRLTLGSNSHARKASKQTVTTPLMTQKDIPTYYMVNLKGISIGNKEVEVEKGIVIDSGSTLTYLDTSEYSRLEALVKEAITAMPMSKPPDELRLCYNKTNSAGFKAPFKMVFQFDGGDLMLEDTNFFIDFGDYVCLGIVPSDGDDGPMIFGNVAQVNFEIEFDLKGKTVSFTPSICNKTYGNDLD